ncbi:MAG: hypothetical protein RLZ84_1693 [Actinomycetota bacterium]
MIVGGYLGAGKTTYVNALLANNDGLRIAVMVNDFGTLSIDAELIANTRNCTATSGRHKPTFRSRRHRSIGSGSPGSYACNVQSAGAAR